MTDLATATSPIYNTVSQDISIPARGDTISVAFNVVGGAYRAPAELMFTTDEDSGFWFEAVLATSVDPITGLADVFVIDVADTTLGTSTSYTTWKVQRTAGNRLAARLAISRTAADLAVGTTAYTVQAGKALSVGGRAELYPIDNSTQRARPVIASYSGTLVDLRIDSTADLLNVFPLSARAVAINAAGTGYARGNTVTTTGGTATQQVIVTVVNIDDDTGAVVEIEITNAGAYTVLPSDPVAQGSTSGSGTGATFNFTSSAHHDAWLIEMIDEPSLPSPVTSFSVTSLAVPAETQSVDVTIEAGKLVEYNSSVLFTDRADDANYFRLLVKSYNESTGALEGICTARGGSGTIADWTMVVVPGAPSGGGAIPTTVVKQGEATSTSFDITAMSGIIAGDLLVLVDFAQGSGPGDIPTTAVPTDFTIIQNDTLSAEGYRQILSCKIADGTESSTTLHGLVGSSNRRKVLLQFRPDVPATQFAVGDPSGEFTAGNPSSQVIAASGGTGPLVVLGAYSSSATVNTRSMTPAKAGETNANTTTYLAWKIYNSAPADVTVDMNDEGNGNCLQGCYIELSAVANSPGDAVVFEDDGSGGPMYPEADGSQIFNLDYSNISNPPTIAAAASQAQQEAASATTVYTAPGTQHFHPAHFKALWVGQITPTAVTGNVSATDTATEIASWSTGSHGFVSGDFGIVASAPLGGLTNGAGYYIGNVDGARMTFHLTRADAIAGTNKVNLTSNAAMTLRKLVYTVWQSFGFPTITPFAGTTAATSMAWIAHLSNALSAAQAGTFGTIFGLHDGASAANLWSMGPPSTLATALLTWANARFANQSGSNPSTWANQSTNVITLALGIAGDHP